jgi:hypothetical protein
MAGIMATVTMGGITVRATSGVVDRLAPVVLSGPVGRSAREVHSVLVDRLVLVVLSGLAANGSSAAAI